MNQKLKHFYFNNTNHGGCGGNSKGAMLRGDHVRPLMRMCQRFIMWRLGHGDAFFVSSTATEQVTSIVEPTVQPTVAQTQPIMFAEL